jgi:hypothetical protein
MDPFAGVVRAMLESHVRFVVIGVWGANYYARSAGLSFTTRDRDAFLPPDPGNLLRAWQACTLAGLTLWVGEEPLDSPRDLSLAVAVVERRAGVTAVGANLNVDLTLVMADFEFDDIWSRRRTFIVDRVEIPVASLTDIVRSKAIVGRPKDHLFLATHEEAIKQLLHGHQWREP